MDDDELVEDFLQESADTVDVFSSLQEEIRESEFSEDVLNDVFRRVHSLKGASSCLTEYDSRMSALSGWCHRFESFLDRVRKGELPFTPAVRDLIGDSLDALATDIERLQEGEGIEDHSVLIASFTQDSQALPDKPISELALLEEHEFMTVLRSGDLLVFRLKCKIDSGAMSDDLNRLMWNHTEKIGPNAVFAIDFGDKYLLPSMAIGGIIGMMNRTVKVYMISPPVFLRTLFKRFNLECSGFEIVDSLTQCEGGR